MVSFVAACRSARALRSRRLSKPVDSTGSGVFPRAVAGIDLQALRMGATLGWIM